MAFRNVLSWGSRRAVTEAKTPAASPATATAERLGYVQGVPPGGIDEYRAGLGASTQTDRPSILRELWEAYLTCPWSWACVTAIARSVTGGGLVMDWDNDTGEGDTETPDKPAEVVAFERLIDFTNPTQDIRQLLRNVVADLQVFADAFIEVAWWGDLPIALYNQDSPTTTPVTDEHGNVSKYVQVTEFGQRVEFEPRQIIHISLDSARPGVFGVSPTQAALLPITSWLFFAAVAKEMARKGLPPNIHADLPPSNSKESGRTWRDQYVTNNLGPANIGNPITTKGGGKVTELQAARVGDVLAAKTQLRDEIVSSYGVPPSKVGIIESGNLGGGTGTDQNRTYTLDTCGPIAELILEKLQFALVVQAFGIEGWHVKFGDVDYRSEQDVENIRDQRLRNGSWTLNKYRASIGEPPVDGGDDAILVDRQNLVLWRDMAQMSRATVAAKGPAAAPGGDPAAAAGPPQDGQDDQNGKGQAEARRIAHLGTYRTLLRETLRARRGLTEATQDTSQAVLDRLAGSFPKSHLAWVKDADWSGPMNIGWDQIDTTHLEDWAASHDGPDVERLSRKARKRARDGRHLKPAVLVRTPGSAKDIIIDGHHHALAAMNAHQPVWAYVGRVESKNGPWDELHTYQKRTAD